MKTGEIIQLTQFEEDLNELNGKINDGADQFKHLESKDANVKAAALKKLRTSASLSAEFTEKALERHYLIVSQLPEEEQSEFIDSKVEGLEVTDFVGVEDLLENLEINKAPGITLAEDESIEEAKSEGAENELIPTVDQMADFAAEQVKKEIEEADEQADSSAN